MALTQFSFSSVTPVFVADENTYPCERSASDRSLLPFRQFAVAAPAIQPFFLTYKSPSPSLFFDTWVMAYTCIEATRQSSTTFFSPPQPFFLRYQSPPPSMFFDTSSSDQSASVSCSRPMPAPVQVASGARRRNVLCRTRTPRGRPASRS